ncbi:hypothetical protein GBF38_007100 [Nibea albiflora]|uniref:Uncharacterized protein n=1 Tax=Nibea albiflora TaxID=240163 RepID=A0ACB7EH76_NIBAL|nr:hypothetical protein GBF38_007100 [Nibea albiflora]
MVLLHSSVDRSLSSGRPDAIWECAALRWESSYCTNSLPRINQPPVSVISFRRVFVGSGNAEQEDRREETSEQRERKLLRLLRQPQND